jgi:hypothetical protein
MAHVVWRLLALLAVLLMPLGMQTAAAAPADHHAPNARMSMDHCPERSGSHGEKQGLITCSILCAAALPSQDMPHRGLGPAADRAVILPSPVLQGIRPETVTPPPKRA